MLAALEAIGEDGTEAKALASFLKRDKTAVNKALYAMAARGTARREDGEGGAPRWFVANARVGASEAATTQSARPASSTADAATTDARLSCPGCFALVCVLCQRHERYKGQYRAVFARGVETSTTSCLRPTDDDGDGADERYREVTCAQCGTVVAVQDDDDVYHFFNVFSAG